MWQKTKKKQICNLLKSGWTSHFDTFFLSDFTFISGFVMAFKLPPGFWSQDLFLCMNKRGKKNVRFFFLAPESLSCVIFPDISLWWWVGRSGKTGLWRCLGRYRCSVCFFSSSDGFVKSIRPRSGFLHTRVSQRSSRGHTWCRQSTHFNLSSCTGAASSLYLRCAPCIPEGAFILIHPSTWFRIRGRVLHIPQCPSTSQWERVHVKQCLAKETHGNSLCICPF